MVILTFKAGLKVLMRHKEVLTADVPALHSLAVVGIAVHRVTDPFFVAELAGGSSPAKLHDACRPKRNFIHPLSLWRNISIISHLCHDLERQGGSFSR